MDILISFASIFILDSICSKYFSHSRWFSLHAMTNFIISCSSFSSLINCIQDPIHMSLDNSIISYSPLSIQCKWPTLLAVSLHIYHLIYFKIRPEDLCHHLLFSPLAYLNVDNMIKNVGLFFACGFPGMITYIALTCKQYNILSSLQEKKIAFLQNLLIRAPGLLFFSFSLIYSYIYASQPSISLKYIILLSICAVMNGLFYLQQIIGSYYKLKINV